MNTKEEAATATVTATQEGDANVVNNPDICKKNTYNFDPSYFDDIRDGLSLDGMSANIADYAEKTAQDYQIPLDVVVALMGAAVGAVAGSKITHTAKYVNSCALWVGVVGMSGDGKSPALDRILEPINDIDDCLWENYQAQLKQWQQGGEKDPRPIEHNIIENDATPESLALSICRNPHGILVAMDELGTFISDLSAYKGQSTKNLLTWWNGKGNNIRRKTQETTRMPKYVHFGIVGGVQPGVIANELTSRKMQLNGFAHRWLWVNIPTNVARTYQGGQPTDNAEWKDFLTNIYHQKRNLVFSPDAEKAYEEWFNQIEKERISSKTDDYTKAMIAKLEINAIRWMIVRHLFACDDSDQISQQTAKIALMDMEHFRRWGEEVGKMSNPEATPNKMTMDDAWMMIGEKYPKLSPTDLANLICATDADLKKESIRATIARGFGKKVTKS